LGANNGSLVALGGRVGVELDGSATVSPIVSGLEAKFGVDLSSINPIDLDRITPYRV